MNMIFDAADFLQIAIYFFKLEVDRLINNRLYFFDKNGFTVLRRKYAMDSNLVFSVCHNLVRI